MGGGCWVPLALSRHLSEGASQGSFIIGHSGTSSSPGFARAKRLPCQRPEAKPPGLHWRVAKRLCQQAALSQQVLAGLVGLGTCRSVEEPYRHSLPPALPPGGVHSTPLTWLISLVQAAFSCLDEATRMTVKGGDSLGSTPILKSKWSMSWPDPLASGCKRRSW